MKEELLTFYEQYKEKVNAYKLASSMMYFDLMTIAPKNGNNYSNHMLSILAGEQFTYATAPEHIEKIALLAKQDGLSDTLKKELALLLKNLEEDRQIPKDVFVDFDRIVSNSQMAWEKAKHENDYAAFKPHLKIVIEKQKEVLTYSKKEMSMYDILLDKYEPKMNTNRYDEFFNIIKKELVPFIHELQTKGKKINDDLLHEHFDIEKQAMFMEELKQYMQCDQNECYMATSEHPFTIFMSSHDARITTHYYEDNLLSAIFSTIHEYGHALYHLQINDDYEGSTLQSDISYAMHESQSRFMENHIGRNPAFWVHNYPKLQAKFASLQDVTLQQFMEMINVSKPSFIRTEADELTYPLHVLIRYELEKQIFNQEVDYDQLPKLWNDKYEEYLGIRPQSDTEGILQDMHWGAANLGYFPTYALGSAYAAQFYNAMEKEVNVEEALKNNQFHLISNWLKTNIHQHGAYKDADQLIQDICHEQFNPYYYINYLKDKYSKLYQL